MEIEIIEEIDGGAFGTVYKAKDNLDRNLAVKIITKTMAGYSSAIEHARALARSAHKNVVSVHAVTKIEDPKTGKASDCIVMEFVEGVTLQKVLDEKQLDSQTLKMVGLQIVDGLSHIHLQGLAHGDFHAKNIMVNGDSVKILDILYQGSLAVLSSKSKEERIGSDLYNLRYLLSELISISELNPEEATLFQYALVGGSGIENIKEAFQGIFVETQKEELQKSLDFAYKNFIDDQFVAELEYAEALLGEVPESVFKELLVLVIENSSVRACHKDYLKCLWDGISDDDRQEVIKVLAGKLDKEVPGGEWVPCVRTLRYFGKSAWVILPVASRLRLENAIINDVASGKIDIYSRVQKGILGTYAKSLGKYFSNREKLIENITYLLHNSWYTQNYVAEHFFYLLPRICDTEDRVSKVIDGIRSAISNDAKRVVMKIEELPEDWQERLK